MGNFTRRQAMGTAAVGVAASALAGAATSEAVAQDQARAAAFAGNHMPRPNFLALGKQLPRVGARLECDRNPACRRTG